MRSIQEERISQLNDKDVQDGDYVLYWMQEAQRASYNYALEYAVQRANELEQPLLVVFGLTADYPEANFRQYAFMLEGLKDAGGGPGRTRDPARRLFGFARRGGPEVRRERLDDRLRYELPALAERMAREAGEGGSLSRRAGGDRGRGAGRAGLKQARTRCPNPAAQDSRAARRLSGRARAHRTR